jgi:hypothetical protein
MFSSGTLVSTYQTTLCDINLINIVISRYISVFTVLRFEPLGILACRMGIRILCSYSCSYASCAMSALLPQQHGQKSRAHIVAIYFLPLLLYSFTFFLSFFLPTFPYFIPSRLFPIPFLFIYFLSILLSSYLSCFHFFFLAIYNSVFPSFLLSFFLSFFYCFLSLVLYLFISFLSFRPLFISFLLLGSF